MAGRKADALAWELTFYLDDRDLKSHQHRLEGSGIMPFPLPPVGSVIRGSWINPGKDAHAEVMRVVLQYQGPNDDPSNWLNAQIWCRRLPRNALVSYQTSAGDEPLGRPKSKLEPPPKKRSKSKKQKRRTV